MDVSRFMTLYFVCLHLKCSLFFFFVVTFMFKRHCTRKKKTTKTSQHYHDVLLENDWWCAIKNCKHWKCFWCKNASKQCYKLIWMKFFFFFGRANAFEKPKGSNKLELTERTKCTQIENPEWSLHFNAFALECVSRQLRKLCTYLLFFALLLLLFDRSFVSKCMSTKITIDLLHCLAYFFFSY